MRETGGTTEYQDRPRRAAADTVASERGQHKKIWKAFPETFVDRKINIRSPNSQKAYVKIRFSSVQINAACRKVRTKFTKIL
jgi:hypothetical protein